MTVSQKIEALRRSLGNELTIFGHHYQSGEVIRHVDVKGDSLELARRVPATDAPNIVFCGVHFMGESAALLARPGQNVYLPAPDADCVMSLMAPAKLVDIALQRLNDGSRTIIPLAYVNTSLAVKTVVGRHGGAVCTSANASRMLEWALDRADAVLFLPDKNLGMNTAAQLDTRYGVTPHTTRTLNIRTGGTHITPELAANARLLLWPGCCSIHARFNTGQINALRAQYPQLIVAVHPECPPDVVQAADMAGSTSALIKLVENAKDGSCIAIGTESNLVERLAQDHGHRLTVLPLAVSTCIDMAKVTEERLLSCLEAVAARTAVPVVLEESLKEPARQSLTRMLEAMA